MGTVTQHYRSPPLPSPAHRPWACQPCAGAAAIHAPAPRPRAAAPAAKDRVTKSSGGRVCTSARKVGALRALVKTAIAADAGTKEPSQPKVAHSMPPSAAAPYTRSQGQRASSRNRPAASEATRAPRHRVRLPNAPSKLSGTAAATASAYPEQQPGRQPPRPHRGTTRAPPRNHPRATHGTRPPRKCVTE